MKNKGEILTALLIIAGMAISIIAGGSFILEKQRKQSAIISEYENELSKLKSEMETLGVFNPAGGLTYRLQSSIGTTDTSVKLSSFKNRSDIPLTMTLLNTDIGYGTLSPQTTRSEFISFTGITQNSDGTATLTGVSRGLSDISPFTASTTLRESHAGQSVFILSDSPQLFEEYAKTRTNMAITGAWTFNTNLPSSSLTATTSSQFVNKALLDATAFAGDATSTETTGGLVELGTLSEQASSYDGGSSKPTVLQTKYSTSTCQVTGAYNIVASSTTGKLDKNCVDQTTNYAWTASTTFSHRVDIPANSSYPLSLNSQSYSFPSSAGASSTVLTTSGSGALSWEYNGWDTIIATTTSAAMHIATTTVTGAGEMEVRINIPSFSSASNLYIGFNNETADNDTTGNYGFSYLETISGATTVYQTGNRGAIKIFQTATTTQQYYVFNIHNEATQDKTVKFHGVLGADNEAPGMTDGAAKWNNSTNAITTINFSVGQGGTVTMPAGTQIIILGRRS